MAQNKKLMTSAIALGTAAVLLLSGTFAWQSMNQEALNEDSDIVNPGGRLHDDFDGTDKNIYVENFGDEPIIARVRLEEYFALVVNQGKRDANGNSLEKTEEKVGTYADTTYTGKTYIFDSKNKNPDGSYKAGLETGGDSWWSWTTGKAYARDDDGNVTNPVYYMPTFNVNKDSLVADVNGHYSSDYSIGGFGVSDAKAPADAAAAARDKDWNYGMTKYDADSVKNAYAIYDADRNGVDELASLTTDQLNDIIGNGTGSTAWTTAVSDENKSAVNLVGDTHVAKQIGDTRGLISMDEWLGMLDDAEGGYSVEDHGNYWVYDTDGWVYWSSLLRPGKTTGLLLDSIRPAQVLDDSYYYAINVEAQFVTADDIGKDLDKLTVADSENNGTGFYDATVNANPTEKAESLLAAITNVDEHEVYNPDTYVVFIEGSDDYAGQYFAYYVDADSKQDAMTTVSSGIGDDSKKLAYTVAELSSHPELVRYTGKVYVGYVKSTGDSTPKWTVHPTDMSYWFQNMGADLEDGAVFYLCSVDTTNLKNLTGTFMGVKFNKDYAASETPDKYGVDLTGMYDTRSVVSMRSMFEDCTNLEEVLLGENWGVPDADFTANVKDMSYMFFNCYKLEIDCSDWNVGSIVWKDYFGKVSSEYRGTGALSSEAEGYIGSDGKINNITYPDFDGTSTT